MMLFALADRMLNMNKKPPLIEDLGALEEQLA